MWHLSMPVCRVVKIEHFLRNVVNMTRSANAKKEATFSFPWGEPLSHTPQPTAPKLPDLLQSVPGVTVAGIQQQLAAFFEHAQRYLSVGGAAVRRFPPSSELLFMVL